jgi:hypothetical protein
VYKDVASHELLQLSLDHFFALKELSDVEDIAQVIYSFANSAVPQDTHDLVLPILQKLTKIQFSQHAQVLLNLIKNEKDMAKLQLIYNQVTEVFAASLNSENFGSRQSCSNILSLCGFFALKAQKLKDMGALQPLLQESVANYLMGAASPVN